MLMTSQSAQSALRAAFRDVQPRRGLPCESISHEEAIDFYRGELSAFSQQDFEYFLPKVLIELLESRVVAPDDNHDVETLMRLLNVQPSATDFEWEEKEFGSDAARYSSRMRRELASIRERRFENFTPSQATAILAFLTVAESWENLTNWSQELRSALAYWRKRAGVSESEE